MKSNMNVIIYSLGRSGSKLLFLILSLIFADQYKRIKLLYEPLYWRNIRCRNYNPIAIQTHLKLPLIISDHRDREIDSFFLRLNGTQSPLLIKFVRGCGRIGYIQKHYPKSKVIILQRSTIEIIKSIAKTRFTLLYPAYQKTFFDKILYPMYGMDSLKSIFMTDFDWNKLKFEIKNLSALLYSFITEEEEKGSIDFIIKDTIYATIMNARLEDYIKEHQNDTFIYRLDYKNITDNPQPAIKNLCSFLNLTYKVEYDEFVKVNSRVLHKPKKLFNYFDLKNNIYGNIKRTEYLKQTEKVRDKTKFKYIFDDKKVNYFIEKVSEFIL